MREMVQVRAYIHAYTHLTKLCSQGRKLHHEHPDIAIQLLFQPTRLTAPSRARLTREYPLLARDIQHKPQRGRSG